jgi:hypothetical protein
MKAVLFLCLFFTITSLPLHPLEGWFIGLGAEANAHTREAVAAGGGLSFGLDINRNFATGLKAAFSHNFDTVSAEAYLLEKIRNFGSFLLTVTYTVV